MLNDFEKASLIRREREVFDLWDFVRWELSDADVIFLWCCEAKYKF